MKLRGKRQAQNKAGRKISGMKSLKKSERDSFWGTMEQLDFNCKAGSLFFYNKKGKVEVDGGK